MCMQYQINQNKVKRQHTYIQATNLDLDFKVTPKSLSNVFEILAMIGIQGCNIIFLQICNLFRRLFQKVAPTDVWESQHFEPGAIYYEITIVLKVKNQVYYNAILSFTSFLVLLADSPVLMSILRQSFQKSWKSFPRIKKYQNLKQKFCTLYNFGSSSIQTT